MYVDIKLASHKVIEKFWNAYHNAMAKRNEQSVFATNIATQIVADAATERACNCSYEFLVGLTTLADKVNEGSPENNFALIAGKVAELYTDWLRLQGINVGGEV